MFKLNTIKFFKKFNYIKPSIIIGSITLIFLISSVAWIFFQNDFLKYELSIVKDSNVPEIEIEGARLFGETDLGKKYFIEAKKILHNNTIKDSVNMTSLFAKILNKRKIVSISSNEGVLNTKNYFLKLNGDVKLSDSTSGLEVFTQNMEGNIHKGEYITSDVYANIKSAIISSSQMYFKENENKILFIGKTYLKIN